MTNINADNTNPKRQLQTVDLPPGKAESGKRKAESGKRKADNKKAAC